MKAIALAASGFLFVMPCERPPVQYQGESVTASVFFAPPDVVDAVCKRVAGIPSDSPRIILACTNTNTSRILMPDPCLYADGYAQLMCHERAHLNRADGSPGWSH